MIADPNLILSLGDGWQPMPSDDPDLHAFHDAARDVVATLSSLALDADPAALEQIARTLVESRLQGEADTARACGHHATIYEPIVAPQPWGQAVAYYGHDETGRQFGFSGIVTPARAITLYMSSPRLTEMELARVMDEASACIAFDHTPIER